MSKKRILWSGESSLLSTGYAVYSREILKRLAASGKYELLELATYGNTDDPEAKELPWQYIGVMPETAEQEEMYRSDPSFQFGEWKFEQTCLDFRPAVCADHRDHWMMTHQERSPFRPFYTWAIMPAVDAIPQNDDWISTYANADAVLGYTDWALDVLKKQSGGRIKTTTTASPGADYDVFKPSIDRTEQRRKLGVRHDALIVGTTMRNQRRKLFPDLFEAFAIFLEQAPPELAEKTYLYCHTTWPDQGWDIPSLLNETGIGHKVLFTYHCNECQSAYPSFFSDAKSPCRRCGKNTASIPNSSNGVSREVLADITNMFDVYVQYSTSEGLGMPAVEAAACGVPVMGVDYSATADVMEKLGGTPIAVQRFMRESETGCKRALPSNADFVEKLIKILSLPSVVRSNMGRYARRAAMKHFNYDKAAEAWMDVFDRAPCSEARWKSPPGIHKPATEVPTGLTDEEFVRWGINHVAGRPELANSYVALRMTRDITWEASLPHMGGIYFNEASTLGMMQRYQAFNREIAMQELLKLNTQKNFWESKRGGQ